MLPLRLSNELTAVSQRRTSQWQTLVRGVLQRRSDAWLCYETERLACSVVQCGNGRLFHTLMESWLGPSATISSRTSRPAHLDRRTPHQAPTPQRPTVAFSEDSSASHTRGVPQYWMSHGWSLQPLLLRLGLAFSDVVCVSGRNNGFYRRSTRTSSRRHQQFLLIVRISLLKFTFSTANSTGSQVGASAWLISTVFWVCLSIMARR